MDRERVERAISIRTAQDDKSQMMVAANTIAMIQMTDIAAAKIKLPMIK
jgi:hypothetical protein